VQKYQNSISNTSTGLPVQAAAVAVQAYPGGGAVTIYGANNLNNLSGVSITGTAGQFACNATTLAVGNLLTISGTLGGTGSIVGYSTPTTYAISATNGSTTFTLIALNGAAIATTAGTPTGLTYSFALPSSTLTTDVNGLFWFYAPNAKYQLVVTPPGATAGVIADVELFDYADAWASTMGATPTTLNPGNTVQAQLNTLGNGTGGSAAIGFIQAGTGAVPRTAQAKMREYVSLQDFGADPTGAADSTAAIVAALATGYPIRDAGTFKVTSTITIPYGAVILGAQFGGSNAYTSNAGRLIFNIAAGIVGFQGGGASGTYEALDWYFDGVVFLNGAKHIFLPNGGVGWTAKNCVFSGASGALITAYGFSQDWHWQNVLLSGGTYGINYPNTAGSPSGYASQFDNGTFIDVAISGQSISGARFFLTESSHVMWLNLKMFGQAFDGMALSGGLSRWSFVNPDTESSGGYTGTAPTPRTTGTINSGSNSLVVASATGIANGTTVTVRGAEVNGVDLSSVVTNVAGTTITLTNNASTSVSGADVCTYLYSAFNFTTSVAGGAYGIQFIGGHIDTGSSVASTRYAINNASGATITCYGLEASYIYDPFIGVSIFGSNFVAGADGVRQPTALSAQNFRQLIIEANANRAIIPSPFGKPLVLALQDSLGNSTGTYGDFELRRYDSNRNRMFGVGGTNGEVYCWGPIFPGSYGAGTGALGTVQANGNITLCWGNAAPTAGTWGQGSKVFNAVAAVGQPKGWVCTVAGTPGTWVSEGNL
jgi:hypothetical protein